VATFTTNAFFMEATNPQGELYGFERIQAINYRQERIGSCNNVHPLTTGRQELTTDQLPQRLIRSGLLIAFSRR
jgi:hypothetical protein